MDTIMLQNMGIIDELNKDIHFKKICIEALEKRIQKKIRIVMSDSDDEGPCEGIWVCPVCNEEIHGLQKFCHKCGQALDWRI